MTNHKREIKMKFMEAFKKSWEEKKVPT